MPSQCKLAAGGLGATEISKPNQEQGRQVEADPLSPASVAEDQSSTNKGVHGGGDACSVQAGAVADAQPAAANSDFDMVLSLLLPGLAIAAGPKRTADPVASPQAPSTVPPTYRLHAAPAPPSNAAPPQLACAPAQRVCRRSDRAEMQRQPQRSSESGSGLCAHEQLYGWGPGRPLARASCWRAEGDGQRLV